MRDEPRVTPQAINDWRLNYGLSTRSPKDAADWWRSWRNPESECCAPAGAVAALGTALVEIERLWADTGMLRASLGEMETRLAGVEAERDHYRAALRVAHDHDVLVSFELARIDAMRCETCAHSFMSGHWGDSLELECEPLELRCSTLGGGCRAWEGKKPTRVWTGPGELERTGYIDGEREGK